MSSIRDQDSSPSQLLIDGRTASWSAKSASRSEGWEERSIDRKDRQVVAAYEQRELRGYWLSTDTDLCGRDELLKVAPFANGLVPVAMLCSRYPGVVPARLTNRRGW
eukprot:PhM_4_TR5895/c0_g4_i3/m.67485